MQPGIQKLQVIHSFHAMNLGQFWLQGQFMRNQNLRQRSHMLRKILLEAKSDKSWCAEKPDG